MKILNILANYISETLYGASGNLKYFSQSYLDTIKDGSLLDEKKILRLYSEQGGKSVSTVTEMRNAIEDDFIRLAITADDENLNLSPYRRAVVKTSKIYYFFITKYFTTPTKFRIIVAERILKLSQEYGIITLRKEICMHLLRMYANTKEIKKFKFYDKLFKDYSEELKVYDVVQQGYCKVAFYHTNNMLHKHLDEVSEIIKECESLVRSHHVRSIHDRLGYIRLFYYWQQKDFRSIVSSCKSTLELLRLKRHIDEQQLYTFEINKGIAYLYLQEYELALSSIKSSLKKETRGSHNWASHQLAYVAASSYNENYTEAYRATREVINHKNFSNLRDRVMEEWYIISAFMSLLVKVDVIDPDVGDKKIKGFRINKFLNEVPKFSKDKSNNNATILIAHVCHLIIDKKYDLAFNRIEAIEKYSVRHLRKKNESFRLNCFLRMLMEIPKSGFHKVGAQRNAQKYKDKLMSVSIAQTGQPILTEIIPFDKLWEIILDSLSLKRHTIRKVNQINF